MVTLVCVNIDANNIHKVVPGVPLRHFRVPHPEKVVQAVRPGESVEEEVVKSLAGLRASCTPPEPAAISLVQRTEKDRSVVKPGELLGDSVDVTD